LLTIIEVKVTHCLKLSERERECVCVCALTSLAKVFGVEYIMRLKSTIEASVT
jgi:hypothetical protein